MKRAEKVGVQAWKDFARLARADDLSSRRGGLMMRSSPKATMWTAGIALSGRLAAYLGLPGFTRWQALAAPAIVGGGFFAVGAMMRYVPRVLSGRLTAVAEANDLNLMEDLRKSQAVAHLNTLWEKVFWYESEIRYGPEERQAERNAILSMREQLDAQVGQWDAEIRKQLGIESDQDVGDVVTAVLSERPLTHDLETSREGFLISALYALKHALPQSSEAHDIGFRLSLYEDFCDGAYFDVSDVKLAEQYAGSQLLADVKRSVGFGAIDVLRQVPRKAAGQLWFALVTRKIAMGTGRAVQLLNQKYETDLFNSQVLLWPGEENACWLKKFSGARDEVLALRTSVVRAALGRERGRAERVIERMFLPCFVFATELRARYDPEYCDGSLDYVCEDTAARVTNNLLSDLQACGFRQKDLGHARRYVAHVQRAQSALRDYLTSVGRATVLEDRVALRAVRISLHTNRNGMKKMFLSRKGPVPRRFEAEIDAAVAEAALYSDRLAGLRLYHQLTVLQLEGYKDLAVKLAYPC